MRLLLRSLTVLCLALSFSSHAKWSYELDDVQAVDDTAISITDEIATFPDPIFMSSTDFRKVDQLLGATLNQENVHIKAFNQAVGSYRSNRAESDWKSVESSFLTLKSLSQSKQALLALAKDRTRDRLIGFGPDGVTQFKQELRLVRVNLEYLAYFQLRSFQTFVNDLFISPVPVIWVGIKVLVIYSLLMWWLRNSTRLIALFHDTQLAVASKPPIWIRGIWYLSRANKAIAWLIAITFSLRILSTIPSLQHLVFLEIFTWWVLGGSIAISFVLEFVFRNSRRSSPEMIALRLSTVQRIVWSVISAGVILQISLRTLGQATIYNWIYSAIVLWFVLVSISVLRLWREPVFNTVSTLSEKPAWLSWAIKHKDTFILSIGGTALAIVWVATHTFQHRVVSSLSQFTFFSQALAYLFKIEVAKQAESIDANSTLVRVRGDQAFKYVLPGHNDSTLIPYASDEIQVLSKYLLSDSPAICVVSGERGVGVTTLINTVLHKVNNAEPIYLNCPYSGYKELLELLALSLGLEETATEIQILAFLRKSDVNFLIAVDNAQRLVKPMVGGLSGIIKLTNLLRRSKKNHRVVMAIEKSSWRFVDRARGERLLFDWVSFLPRWNEQQIQQLLDSRINHNEEHGVSFDGLIVPKQWDQEDITEAERAKKGFYRILWHYSDGNPTVALRFFRLSLNRDKKTNQVKVRLFNAPQSTELESMPKPMLAVIRSIVQLEVASPEELSECTQLSIAEVTGTLRYFQSRGFIEWSEDKARVSDHWFRHITNVLDRQHLLVK
ncbi:AAA family ATPase [Vibrio sp. 10N.261.55.A7]|uniref:AAA family ATPase n=1 Tax=Vibrio sp. 10N.261.55.A7 TaxID=1880851 RepID=UPI000C8217A4|nr:AAA family ATPase [Vibrio sp. 10N.261.55.A7]PMJ92104.1 AAA family ATPase [Vibrio sp. 10N.261.55.A7]